MFHFSKLVDHNLLNLSSVLVDQLLNVFLLLPFLFIWVHNTGADLSDADLRAADFSLANVTKVIFLRSF